jgi:hypothetical protein
MRKPFQPVQASQLKHVEAGSDPEQLSFVDRRRANRAVQHRGSCVQTRCRGHLSESPQHRRFCHTNVRAYEPPATRGPLDHAAFGQLAQRPAHGDATHSKLVGELALAWYAITRPEPTAVNCIL